MDRQYIGARYVPKFADPIEWNDQTSYEALTIVVYMGASYTSKKAVPAGVRPTDNGYWALTGNYNAQVEEYRQQVVTLNDDYNKRFYRKWLFIGDSYAYSSNWVTATANLLGLTTDDYFNISQSGHGFGGGKWLADIQEWVASNLNEVANIGNIVVAGGLNDSMPGWGSTLGNDIGAFGAYCKSTFDNATVSVAYIGWSIDSAGTNNTTGWWRGFAQSKYSLASFYGMQYLSGCEMVTHKRSFMGEDGYHPTIAASGFIANAIVNALKTGCATVDWDRNYGSFTPVSGTSDTSINQTTSGKTVFTEIYFSCNDLNVSLTGATAVEIGTMVLPYSNGIPQQRVMVNYQDSDGKYHTAPFHLQVVNDKVLLSCRGISEAGTGYSGANIRTINPFVMYTAHNALVD